MSVFTEQQRAALFENGKPENRGKDHFPLARLLFKANERSLVSETWLITEMYEDRPNIAMALHTKHRRLTPLWQEPPPPATYELKEVNLAKLAEMQDNGGELLFDANFAGEYPASIYMKAIQMTQGFVGSTYYEWSWEILVEEGICTEEEAFKMMIDRPDSNSSKKKMERFTIPQMGK